MATKRSRRAFTLVELLVVIGIIAVLISVLLPSLQRARMQANLIACGSNLHQIDSLVQIYVSENRGYLPYGHTSTLYQPISVQSVSGGIFYQSQLVFAGQAPEWDWPDTLTRLNKKTAPGDVINGAVTPTWPQGAVPPYPAQNEQNMAADYLPIFHDYDSDGMPYATRVSDFTANGLLLIDNSWPDPKYQGAAQVQSNPKGPYYLALRNLGTVRRGSDTALAFCGQQNAVGGQNQYDYISTNLDWNIDASMPAWTSTGYGCEYPVPAHSNFIVSNYDNPISISNEFGRGGFSSVLYGSSAGIRANYLTGLREENIDNTQATLGDYVQNYTCAMRFRHMNNTQCNILFVDGHVESRVLGTVLAQEISVNDVVDGPPAGY